MKDNLAKSNLRRKIISRLIIAHSDSDICAAKTAMGDIDLYIPRGTSARFHAQTQSGTITFSNLTFTEIKQDSSKTEGKLGTGSGDIHITKDNRNIEIIGF